MTTTRSEVQCSTREIRLDITTGALLSAGAARYHTLAEYISQFAAPLSSLQGAGVYVFSDPIAPQLRLLLETVPEPACDVCGLVLEDCGCRF